MAVIAFGTAARIAKGAIIRAREQNIRVGMIRPVTLWPFPSKAIQEIGNTVKHFLVFELNTGQMVEDVRLTLNGRGEIRFYGRPGGIVPTPLEISRVIASQYYKKRLD
jgi:2-oxoglutarate ferredoxin oxidoreductase subunit alpha